MAVDHRKVHELAAASARTSERPPSSTSGSVQSADAPEAGKDRKAYGLLRQLSLFRSQTGRVFADIDGEAIAVDSKRFFERAAHRFMDQHDELVAKATIE